MSLLLLAIGLAHAGIVAEIGPPVETGTAGTWARALPTEDGWRLGIGTAGNFHIGPLLQTGSGLGDWEFDERSKSTVTDHGDLKDHNVQMCPDGGYYIVSSANVVDHNDSAYSWFADADLNIVASGVLEERNPSRAHNDMAALCSPWGTGAAFGGYGDGGGGSGESIFIEQDETATNIGEIDLGGRFLMGAGLLADAATDRIILTTAEHSGELTITTFTPEWAELSEVKHTVAEPGQRTYWPSGIIRVGQYYAVVMMSADDTGPGGGDTGNVYLHILTEDFDIVESHKLTDLQSGMDAAMRPWVARRDDLLLVTYDVMTQHTVQAVSLDLSGIDEVDEGFDEEDGGADGDDAGDADASGEDGDKGGCATVSAGSSGLTLAALSMLAVGRRRNGATLPRG